MCFHFNVQNADKEVINSGRCWSHGWTEEISLGGRPVHRLPERDSDPTATHQGDCFATINSAGDGETAVRK